MSNELLDDRRKALEEAFFRKENERLRERLRQREARRVAADRLGKALGIGDAALLERLAALGIDAEVAAALALVPLVEIAWADGELHPREREAIMRAAAAEGVAAGSASYELLESWMRERPGPELMEAWGDYLRTLCAELPAAERKRLGTQLLDRARATAEAAGGFLGLGRVSGAEERVLARLRGYLDR